jgi:hypothetical protein
LEVRETTPSTKVAADGAGLVEAEEAKDAAIHEMWLELERQADKISDAAKRQLFASDAEELIFFGEHTWRAATGRQILWSERPSLFRLAVKKYEAGDCEHLCSCVIAVIGARGARVKT